MLIPQEKPYLQGLNSYYLIIDRFVEHLQGEIGSGCLHLGSPSQEVLIYFDEQEVLRGVLQRAGRKAKVCSTIEPLLNVLKEKNFIVTVYKLAPHSIFFWSQLPSFERSATEFNTTNIALPVFVVKLVEKKFSGFLKIDFIEKDSGALLFFNKGEMTGGSYPWGNTGLDPSDKEYRKLCEILKSHPAKFKFGQFLDKTRLEILEGDSVVELESEPESEQEGEIFFELESSLEDFLTIFVGTVEKKKNYAPESLLKQKFLDNADRYPFLDPFQAEFAYSRGKINFTGEILKEDIARAVLDCAWSVVEDCGLSKNFNSALERWHYKNAMEQKGISVER